MAFRKLVDRLTKPVEELDREALHDFCTRLGTTPIEHAQPRQPVRVAGEVRSVRIVPRAGADALEVMLNDGRGAVTGVFLGRRRVGGISPGRKLVFEGVVVAHGKEKQIFNPAYTLL